ncbi:hypothetical protein AYX14_05403 [Cryptococcus neoformans]|nr:hypothetical protein AYX14_05403 [Cryptococcus neoformans var. grubii]
MTIEATGASYREFLLPAIATGELLFSRHLLHRKNSPLTTKLSEAQLWTAHLQGQVAQLTSHQKEAFESRSWGFDKPMSILTQALFKQLAEKRVAQLEYDTVTANVLDTPQRLQDAAADIMSNREQHAEIRSFVKKH